MYRPFTILALSFACVFALKAQLQAAVAFSAEARSTLTLTGISTTGAEVVDGEYQIIVDAYPFDEFSAASGLASAGTAGTTDTGSLTVGSDIITLESIASGAADSPPLSTAESLFFGNGGLLLVNYSGTDVYTFSFELTWDYIISAFADDPLFEFGFASAGIFVGPLTDLGEAGGSLAVVNLFESVDTGLGGEVRSDGEGPTAFDVTVPAASFIEFVLYNDADGFAESDLPPEVVPEPASFAIWMLLAPAAGLAIRRRARKRTAA